MKPGLLKRPRLGGLAGPQYKRLPLRIMLLAATQQTQKVLHLGGREGSERRIKGRPKLRIRVLKIPYGFTK